MALRRRLYSYVQWLIINPESWLLREGRVRYLYAVLRATVPVAARCTLEWVWQTTSWWCELFRLNWPSKGESQTVREMWSVLRLARNKWLPDAMLIAASKGFWAPVKAPLKSVGLRCKRFPYRWTATLGCWKVFNTDQIPLDALYLIVVFCRARNSDHAWRVGLENAYLWVKWKKLGCRMQWSFNLRYVYKNTNWETFTNRLVPSPQQFLLKILRKRGDLNCANTLKTTLIGLCIIGKN